MRIGMGAVGAAGAAGVDGAAGERSDTSAPIGAVAIQGKGRPSDARGGKSGRPQARCASACRVPERLRPGEEAQADIASTVSKRRKSPGPPSPSFRANARAHLSQNLLFPQSEGSACRLLGRPSALHPVR